MYRIVAENITKLAETKGSFLKTAAREIADKAQEKIEKIKEDAII